MTAKGFFLLSIAFGVVSALAGCFGSSQSSRFYTLAPAPASSYPAAAGLERTVAVGPVMIPEYLNRKQIVTRSGGNEIFLSEFDRWGGPLDDEITRVLVADLSERLNSLHLAVFPWRSGPFSESRIAYRIPVSIVRFDGTPGGKVVLNATWGVLVKGEKQEDSLFASESTITEEVKGQGYDALVAAMGKAVERLGNEIAGCLIKTAADKSQ